MPATYPATTFAEAVDLFEQDIDIFHQTLNGDVNTEVSVDSGTIPSVRKAIADMGVYKAPIAWANGVTETDHLQPRVYSGNAYVPITVPTTMGAAPDSNWSLYNFVLTEVDRVIVEAVDDNTGNVILNDPNCTHDHSVIGTLPDETNIVGVIDSIVRTQGGVDVRGYTNAQTAVKLTASADSGLTSDTGDAPVIIDSFIGAGGSTVALSATQNLAAFQTLGQTRAVVKGDGSFNTQGSISAVGDISGLASDERLKENVKPIPFALNKVKQLNGVTFEFNEAARQMGLPEEPQLGLIAQDVEKVLPEAVMPFAFDEKYKNVKYDKLVGLLVEAVKELSAEVEELKNGSTK